MEKCQAGFLYAYDVCLIAVMFGIYVKIINRHIR